MKNLYLKLINFFKGFNINFNLVLGILIVMGLIFITIKITNSKERQKALEVEKARIELITKSLDESNLSQAKRDSLDKLANDYYKKISQNENIDWTDLFTSDADSVARDVAEWDNRNKSKPSGK